MQNGKALIHKRCLRFFLYVCLLLTGFGVALSSEDDVVQDAKPVYLVDIKSMINPGSLSLLQNAIKTANTNDAAALILRINTPGGFISTTREMVSSMSQSSVPIIGYVGPSGANAGSAGAFILLAADVAAMNTGTNMGASAPVAEDGRDIDGTLGKKIMNDSRAFMRSIADSHKRNAEVAESLVSEAKSLTATEAHKQKVIDLLVEDESALLSTINGREIIFHGERRVLQLAGEVRQVEPRLIDLLLQFIANPSIAHLLISLGALGVFIEVLSPGLALPGILGAIAVILGLVGAQALPVNIGFLMLLFLGLVLMTSEHFVSGFGVLGVGGAVAFILGSLNLFDTPTSAEYQSSILSVSIAVSAAMIVTTILIARSLWGGTPNKRVQGKIGEAMVNFDRQGHVLLEDQCWPAVTTERLHHGDKVTVTGKDEAGRLKVRKADS